MLRTTRRLMSDDGSSAKVPVLMGMIALIIYLTARNSGLYPMIFGDEYLYNAYSRLLPTNTSPRPSYIYYLVYGLTNNCGDAFLDCARQINVIFFALSLPLIYTICRRFSSVNLSIFVSLCAVFSPINSYSTYFMPESMNFFFFWALTWFVVKEYETRSAWIAVGVGGVLACMSMVKPHAIFLVPALFMAFFSDWIFGRTFNRFKRACGLAAISITAFFLVRLPLGYLLAGIGGLSIMGGDYGGYAHSMREPGYMIGLMSLARHNLWGHVLAVTVMFGVPIALMLQIPLKTSANCSEAESKARFLRLYTGTLLISLMIIVALFAATTISMGPYESIERLSLRHYNFIFPLFLIIATSPLGATLERVSSAFQTKWIALVIAGLAVYAFVAIRGFTPSVADSPELLAITSNSYTFNCLGGGMVICLVLMTFRPRLGAALYLIVLMPVTVVTSAITLDKGFRSRLSPDTYDQAGQFTSRYLGKDAGKLLVFGPDLASVMRTSFYMSPPPSGFYAVPNGQNIDKELQPYLNDFSKEWVLLIGNYQYSFKTKERIHIPVRNAAGGVAGDYTLISLKRGCDTSPANIGSKTATSADNIEVMPGPQTPHTIGKFNPTGASMVAGKGESGAIIYGPYIKLRPGCYAATFHVTAESAVLGTEVGTLDVSEYMPPNVDERVVYIPLQSATGEQSVKLTFKVDNPAYVYQFRVWTNGVANQVSIRSINIERI